MESLYSLGFMATRLQSSVASVRAALEAIRATPSLVLNDVPHYSVEYLPAVRAMLAEARAPKGDAENE